MIREELISQIRVLDGRAHAAIGRMELELLSNALDERARLIKRLVHLSEGGGQEAVDAFALVARATSDLQARLAGRLAATNRELGVIRDTSRALGAYARTG